MNANETTIRELNALIETNLDAVEVVGEGLEALKDLSLKVETQRMLDDHQQAVSRLRKRVEELGGASADDAHAANVLRESWQKMWKGGEDREVLLALRANERVAVDGLRLQMTKEEMARTMSEEGVREHTAALEMELRHFQLLTDRLRSLGASVDNDEVMGAMRNAAEHLYAAANLAGEGIEAFTKWVTGVKG